MNITKESGELSIIEQYQLTMSPKIQRIKDCAGQRFEVAKWCVYEDVDKKSGEIKEILSMMSPEGEVFATNSETFKSDFKDIISLLESAGICGTVFSLEVITGKSKAGRDFYTCALVE